MIRLNYTAALGEYANGAQVYVITKYRTFRQLPCTYEYSSGGTATELFHRSIGPLPLGTTPQDLQYAVEGNHIRNSKRTL